jgi:uncharacterized membrane protein YgcG
MMMIVIVMMMMIVIVMMMMMVVMMMMMMMMMWYYFKQQQLLVQLLFTTCYRRNFEGDENDRKHFGPAPNKLMPDVVNLQTHINISHAQMNKNNGAFKALKNSERDAERWLEKVGKEGRWCVDDNDDVDGLE